MGIRKHKWTQEEEDALIAGIEKYGPGKWREIQLDPQFAPSLVARSNVDLKDKWRNMNVRSTLRLNAAAAPTPTAAVTSQVADQVVENPSPYNALILQAVSTLKDANGSDLNAIVKFVEENHEVPASFRREVTTRLRGLVNQGMLEKVRGCYKIKRKSPSSKHNDARPQQQPAVSGVMVSNDPMKQAADTAAHCVADAENISYLADEAVKEMEIISSLADENDLKKQLTMEYYKHCAAIARGAVVHP